MRPVLHTKFTFLRKYFSVWKNVQPLQGLLSITHRANRGAGWGRIRTCLRGRPHKEQPPGLEPGTQGRLSWNQTARPYLRPPFYSNYNI